MYEDILKDEVIIKGYRKIDLSNKFVFNHGLKHINNVLGYAQNAINLFRIFKNNNYTKYLNF